MHLSDHTPLVIINDNKYLLDDNHECILSNFSHMNLVFHEARELYCTRSGYDIFITAMFLEGCPTWKTTVNYKWHKIENIMPMIWLIIQQCVVKETVVSSRKNRALLKKLQGIWKQMHCKCTDVQSKLLAQLPWERWQKHVD